MEEATRCILAFTTLCLLWSSPPFTLAASVGSGMSVLSWQGAAVSESRKAVLQVVAGRSVDVCVWTSHKGDVVTGTRKSSTSRSSSLPEVSNPPGLDVELYGSTCQLVIQEAGLEMDNTVWEVHVASQCGARSPRQSRVLSRRRSRRSEDRSRLRSDSRNENANSDTPLTAEEGEVEEAAVDESEVEALSESENEADVGEEDVEEHPQTGSESQPEAASEEEQAKPESGGLPDEATSLLSDCAYSASASDVLLSVGSDSDLVVAAAQSHVTVKEGTFFDSVVAVTNGFPISCTVLYSGTSLARTSLSSLNGCGSASAAFRGSAASVGAKVCVRKMQISPWQNACGVTVQRATPDMTGEWEISVERKMPDGSISTESATIEVEVI